MKKYIAKTDVSVNVILANGKNVHVSFTAVTGGSSVFYTNDKELQNALERHYKYGRLFREDPSYEGMKPKGTKAAKDESESRLAPHEEREGAEEASTETVDSGEEGSEVKTISVSDPDAAKAYLAEHFGVSRTKLKSLKAIKEAAEANGIVFEGI